MRIHEDPFIRQALASRSYDSEGASTDIVKDGVVQEYLLGSYSARKLGMKTTGSASGGKQYWVADTGVSFVDLIQQMHTGLMVTELFGSGVNTMTGDYSRGAVGYWIEDGLIQHLKSNEVTIAGISKTCSKALLALPTILMNGVRFAVDQF